MPIYFRLDSSNEPVEVAADDDPGDRRKRRWSHWMANNQQRLVTEWRYRGGAFNGGFSIIGQFMGITELSRTHPNFPRGIWRIKTVGVSPANGGDRKRFRGGTRSQMRATMRTIESQLRTEGILGSTEARAL